MKTKLLVKALCLAIALVMVLSLAACGSKPAATEEKKAETTVAPETQKATEAKAEPVTIKFFSNLPDRNSGQGKLEQQIIDNYMKENPNVKIELEMLQDEPYKQKFKAYTASNSLPDLFNCWGQAAFMGPAVKAGLLAELNPSDYSSYTFNKGSFDAFSADGKLYGLPRNQDIMFMFYNKAIFDKAGVKVPTNFQELIKASKDLRAKGITPCATPGKDKWTQVLMFQDILIKTSGDQKLVYNASEGKVSFAKDETIKKAANYMKQLMDTKFYQDGFTSADYGASRNLFAQGKTAMWHMGAWEMGLATDSSLSDDFKKNVAVMKFPAIDGEKGKDTDYLAWNGGGYAVAANSKVKAEAVKLLNYMFKPDNWPKLGWQEGLVTPAQDVQPFFTGKETDVQKDLTKILAAATSMSGTTFQDNYTPTYKTDIESACQEFAAGLKNVDQFLETLDKAAAKIGK